MKKFLIFGLIAAGAAVAAAAIFKSKSKRYICDDEDDEGYDNCYCGCDDDCCGDICEIPAEKAEESSVPGNADSKKSDSASDELGI